jgi:uncharacterized protein (TIGR02186 family)
MMRALLFTLALVVSVPAMAQDRLVLELAQDRVDITTGFGGTEVVAFGVLSGMADGDRLAITLKGPETKVIVREKSRAITGVWSNNKNVDFRRVPSYYDYALSDAQTAQDLESPVFKQAELGADNLAFYPEDDMKPEDLENFHDALIRLMQGKNFYPVKATEISFTGKDLFKARFAIPPGVPTGTYTVQAVLFRGDQLIEKTEQTLQIGQVGFNARVYLFAKDYSFFYGLLAVLTALIFGWSAFTFLRRD